MIFWIVTSLLVVAGLVMLLPAVFRSNSIASDDHRQQNIQIARDRSRELKADLGAGVISDEAYQQALDELEKNLLSDVDDRGLEDATIDRLASPKLTMLALVILLPLLGFGMYLELGSPQYLNVSGPGSPAPRQDTGMNQPEKIPTVDEMIAGLKRKTAETPDDPNAWYLLGRLYASLQKFDESVNAYEKLVEVSDRQPTALVVLADSIAMTQDGSLSGRPIELIMEALEAEPGHTTALWMAGQAAVDRNDYLAAIQYWRKALPGLDENAEMQNQLRAMIEEAIQEAKQSGLDVSGLELPAQRPDQAASQVEMSVSVSLDESLLNKLGKDDVLFVFARAANGPRMPVVAIKSPAEGFPKKLKVDDSSLLQPGRKLLDYGQLEFAARISSSGDPIGKSGDIESDPVVVDIANQANVELVINRTRP